MNELKQLNIQKREKFGNLQIQLNGPLTSSTLPTFRQEMESLFSESVQTISLDLAGVPFIDSRGIGELMGLHRECLRKECPIEITNISEKIMEVLRLNNLDVVLPIRKKNPLNLKEFPEYRQDLLESHQYNEQILSGLGDALFWLDTEGRVLLINPEAERLFQIKEEDILLKDFCRYFKVFHPGKNSNSSSDCPIHQVAEGKRKSYQGEILVSPNDNTPTPLRINAASLEKNDQIIGAVCGLKNTALENDAEGELIFRNRFLEKLLGLSDVSEICQSSIEQLAEVMPIDAAGVLFRTPAEESRLFELIFSFDIKLHPPEKAINGRIPLQLHEETLFFQTINDGKKFFILRDPQPSPDPKLEKKPHPLYPGFSQGRTLSIIFLPLKYKGDIIGGITIQSYRPNAYSKEQMKRVESIIPHITLSLMAGRTHEALKDSENRYRQLVDNVNDVIYTLEFKDDPSQAILTSIGGACERLLGYQPEQLIGQSALSVATTKTFQKSVRMLKKKKEQGLFRTVYEIELKRKDGTVVPVEINSRLYEESDGTHRVLGIARDITERKKAQEDQKLLATAINQAVESTLITDVEGVIQYVSPAFEKMSGYKREEVIGKTHDFMKSERHSPEFYRNLLDTIYSGKVWQGRKTNRRKDGVYYEMELTISPVRNDAGEITHFVTVGRDITQEVHLEEQLRQAQKMEAVGQLAAGVAHDFNNLLQAVYGHTYLALDDLSQEQAAYSNLLEIRKATEAAGSLTQKLLAFSRKQSSCPVCLEFNELIQELMKILERLIDENIQINFKFSPEKLYISADPRQVEQILINLCVNSRDAMPSGGTLTIETSKVHWDESDCLAYPWCTPGEYARLRVSDTGCGINEATGQHIFEPFFTTKEVGKGTGLGLSTTYGIVKNHQGVIRFDSTPGQGTDFFVYFPFAEIPQFNETIPNEEGNVPASGSETILVAEDDPVVRSLVEKILKSQGYQIILAADGKEAVEVFEKHHQKIDLVLLDMIMPRINGYDSFQEMQKIKPDVKVVFSSGYLGGGKVEEDIIRDKKYPSISKPYHPNQISQIIQNTLKNKKNS